MRRFFAQSSKFFQGLLKTKTKTSFYLCWFFNNKIFPNFFLEICINEVSFERNPKKILFLSIQNTLEMRFSKGKNWRKYFKKKNQNLIKKSKHVLSKNYPPKFFLNLSFFDLRCFSFLKIYLTLLKQVKSISSAHKCLLLRLHHFIYNDLILKKIWIKKCRWLSKQFEIWKEYH